MISLLGATPEWVINTFPIFRIIIMAIIGACAVALIVLILCQKSEGESGANAITGTNESYYSQNKGKTQEGRLKKATMVFSIIIAVMVVIYFVLTSIYKG